jgi:hypothetical protein
MRQKTQFGEAALDIQRSSSGRRSSDWRIACGASRKQDAAVRRLVRLVSQVTSSSRLEWLVVASIVVLLAVALALGWIRVELPGTP